ncbi:orotidine-5'-phosphate decarboxylase [Xylocopilactobacillus apis]|uniref:Orotidine 5'-phosphate decarboxylase n=1 Tax=Xylocopilactobacillus apis TaxID=2932183 RepID=A0AAU9DC47_9LACO|nr:orotidine-5'-phosphate decarboxylase [Xylocopilactobacillus apis]BDR57345.1 orotidine 5'-phosphate decarboxylase [Xylocopilactobacillus apis]
MKKPVIIALDFVSAEKVYEFLEPFSKERDLWVKVGMELFYGEGPALITNLRKRGLHVFLDLKLYDIPHTVNQAMKQIGRLGVEMTTVTGLGGAQMIQAAKDGLLSGASEAGIVTPKLLAITQLTSMTEVAMHETLQNDQYTMVQSVDHLAQLAANNGADGVISSALEAKSIHERTSREFLTINPGIRLESDAKDDQARVVTPAKAAELGSNGIVVGRSITQASDPLRAYKQVKLEFKGDSDNNGN